MDDATRYTSDATVPETASLVGGLKRSIEHILGPSTHPDCAAVIDVTMRVVGKLVARGSEWEAEVGRLTRELAATEAASLEHMTPQNCALGAHPDWAIDSDETFACPWCALEQARAERDEARQQLAALKTEWGAGHPYDDGGPGLCTHGNQGEYNARQMASHGSGWTVLRRLVGEWRPADGAGDTAGGK